MKTLITILIFAFALVLTSCEKEKTPVSVTLEDLTNYEVFKINVKQLDNGQAVNNYELYFRMLKFYHISGSTQGVILKDSVLYSVKTDANGNAMFKIHKDSLSSDVSIYIHKSYTIGGLESFSDSLSKKNSNWQFKSPPQPVNVYNDTTLIMSDIKFELIRN
jgi:hypothetical protein